MQEPHKLLQPVDKEKKTVRMDHDTYDQHRHAAEIVEETPLHHWFKDSLEDNMEIHLLIRFCEDGSCILKANGSNSDRRLFIHGEIGRDRCQN
nr:putative peptidase C26, class I glutamine amidotransferase-like protein [Tanacetum cinerariifolium]